LTSVLDVLLLLCQMRCLIFPGSHKSNTGFNALLWLRWGRTERTESKLHGGIEKQGKE